MNKLDIINAALRKVGTNTISNFDHVSLPGQAALLAYDFVVKQVLRDYAWGFATKFARLAQNSEKPPFGYSYSYQLPSDCVVLLSLHASEDLSLKQPNFTASLDMIFSESEEAYVKYVSDSVPTEKWTVDFCDALATKIAHEIAITASQNPNAQAQLAQLYTYALEKAKYNDMLATNDIELNQELASKLLQARFS